MLDAPDGTLAGVVGVERHHAASRLLRSLAVRQEWRGRGYGRALLTAALAEATDAGVDAFLLTTDAQAFFAARGFAVVSSSDPPKSLSAACFVQPPSWVKSPVSAARKYVCRLARRRFRSRRSERLRPGSGRRS